MNLGGMALYYAAPIAVITVRRAGRGPDDSRGPVRGG
jgi:hypothetical protein